MAAPAITTRSGAGPGAIAWPLTVATAAWTLGRIYPLVSPLIVALIVGAVIANGFAPSPRRVVTLARQSSFLLRLGVALLGLRLALSDLTRLGAFGVILVAVTVASTFVLTQRVGQRMGLEPELVSLIASGFAVCGAAAIAAVQDGVRARHSVVGLALALVTVHGTVMLALIPLLGRLFGLGPDTVAIWAGASIHEVAQVAAAASLIGSGALALAMVTKLGRVCLLVFVHGAVAHRHRASSGPAWHEIPWFLYAFVGAVALRATGVVPARLLDAANVASTICLAAGMFGLGLGLVVKELWPIPMRAVALSCVATATVTGVPLVLLLVFGAR